MLDRTVTDPSGTTWAVGIRTRPRWRALSHRFGAWRRRHDPARDVDVDVIDLGTGPMPVRHGGAGDSARGDADLTPDGDGGLFDGWVDDLVIGLIVAIVVILAVLLAWWVLIPLLLLLVDAVVVALLFVLGLFARVAVGRPWVVRAREKGAGGRWYEVEQKGWRNARDLQRDWESAITRGQVVVTSTRSASSA